MGQTGFTGTSISKALTDPLIVTWRSPSNIALVKYWGKTGRQLPLNPSLSMTLTEAFTETKLTLLPEKTGGEVRLDFLIDRIPNPTFGHRISGFLKSVSDMFPFLSQAAIRIETHNTFPHSAGIASSASAFSALALCICSMEEKLSGKPLDDFFLTASSLSRLGSGSACRSVYGGFCLWGETGALLSSSDLHAVALDRVHPVFYDLQDAILILSNKEKKVSSSRGHERMDVHPYAKSRILHANSNTNILLKALQEGDIDTFIQVTENEALTLHALMMTSQPGFMLMEPESVRIIRQIQAFRENTGLKVCYTLDAGPNVHLLFFKKDFEQVKRLIVEDLIINDKQNSWIHDKCGSGPQKVNQAFR